MPETWQDAGTFFCSEALQRNGDKVMPYLPPSKSCGFLFSHLLYAFEGRKQHRRGAMSLFIWPGLSKLRICVDQLISVTKREVNIQVFK